MSFRRFGVGVVVFDGYLYVIGGFDGILFLNIVEKYDFKINRWSLVVFMGIRRKYFGVVFF